jgi:hypothetical protein
MATRRKAPEKTRARNPATTPEGRENQLVNAAVDLAEQQILDGSASAQVISHYLKLGSSRERLEQERLQHENKLLQARREQLESQKRVEDLYEEALNAMRRYAGQDPLEIEGTYED